jgi:hypothetical protein
MEDTKEKGGGGGGEEDEDKSHITSFGNTHGGGGKNLKERWCQSFSLLKTICF